MRKSIIATHQGKQITLRNEAVLATDVKGRSRKWLMSYLDWLVALTPPGMPLPWRPTASHLPETQPLESE